MSCFPGQAIALCRRRRAGNWTYNAATNVYRPNRHGATRKTVVGSRPRVVSSPTYARSSSKVVSVYQPYCLQRQRLYLALGGVYFPPPRTRKFSECSVLLSDFRARQRCGNGLVTSCALILTQPSQAFQFRAGRPDGPVTARYW